ncbi:MAG: CBS domain-containing protein [Candidatus Aenigmatarchaeota archaeon]
MLKVKDVMSKKIITISPEQTIAELVKILIESKISGMPVVKEGKIVGIITEADILDFVGKKNLLAIDGNVLKEKGMTKVKEIMKRVVIVANEEDGLDRAVLLMTLYKVRRLPVVDKKNNIVGIISRDDIIRSIAKMMSAVPEKIVTTEKAEVSSVTEKIPTMMETDIDRILAVIKEKKRVKFSELEKMFEVGKETIEEWAKVLEDHGLAEIFYPAIGEPELRWKK